MRGLTDAQIATLPLKLSDAYLAIAREYGFPSWPKLKTFVERDNTTILGLPAHERISDPDFRRAVDLIDCGNVNALRQHLRQHPTLIRRRATLYGGNYFQTPTLLEFIAENPSRRGALPKNIAEVARVLLEAGAADDRSALDSALALVASSNVARESGVQRALIDMLCDFGASPDAAMLDSLMYGEFDSVAALLEKGADMTLIAAAALGRAESVQALAPAARDDELRLALALAAQHGRIESVRVLLEAGADAAGFTPPPGHSHATPLHQAALMGHDKIVELLLAHGARPDVRDILYGGTAAGWAQHNGFGDLAARLHNDTFPRP
jgi:ankyrin repeat protein